MKTTLSFILLTVTLATGGQVPVIDLSALVQLEETVRITGEQLAQTKIQVERLGNPASIRPVGGKELIDSLGVTGVGRTLEELRSAADGIASLFYDGDGLYSAPEDIIETSDGQVFPRDSEQYRKFDAVTQAKTALEDVMRDTEDRRQSLLAQVQATVTQLQTASTHAESQKLHAVLTAQGSELAAIDRERDAALSRVLVQHIENQTDEARQEQSRREERIIDFRSATEKLGTFLTPDTTPVRIPDPRTRRP